MTNAQIIFSAAQELAEEGKIKYTGRVLKAVNAAGEEVEIKETEDIHTYKEWQNLGMQVQKGKRPLLNSQFGCTPAKPQSSQKNRPTASTQQ